MIITVTMNPAIDKTVDIEAFNYGGLNRISSVVLDPGGKGINVSKTIRHLGGKTVATGFLGGTGGVIIKNALKELEQSQFH
jgi:1-phosphofructokinase